MKKKKIIVTTDWLKSQNACKSGYDRFVGLYGASAPLKDVIEGHINDSTLDYANWLIVRKMAYAQYVSYAVFAAEQVIANYEAVYPNDTRPRDAIEAAKKCISDPSEANKSAADSAAESAAESAARSAAWSAAESAARSAADSARSAWSAADSAARSAADSAARSAADSARSAWSAAESAMRIKILRHGLELLEEGRQ
jgi:hypothetical protein